MTAHETRRQLLHLGVLLFAIPVPFLGPKWSAALAAAAIVMNWVVLPLTGKDRELRRDGERFVNGVRIYPIAVLLLIVLFPLAVATAAWAVLAVGDSFSNLIGRRFGSRKLPWHAKKSWAGTFGFFVTAFPAAVLFFLWTRHFAGDAALLSFWNDRISIGGASLLAVIAANALGAAAAAIAESLDIPVDDNLSVSLTSAAGIVAALSLLAAH